MHGFGTIKSYYRAFSVGCKAAMHNRSKEEDFSALVDEAVRQYGCLDVMVNNAGRMQQNHHTPLDQIRIQDFDATFKLNVRGTLLGIMHAARYTRHWGSTVLCSLCVTFSPIVEPCATLCRQRLCTAVRVLGSASCTYVGVGCRVMKARSVRGCIINLGSISGMRGCSYEDLPYQCSKATIIALTRTAAAKLILDGIRVNCVSPSMTRTVRVTKGA